MALVEYIDESMGPLLAKCMPAAAKESNDKEANRHGIKHRESWRRVMVAANAREQWPYKGKRKDM